MRRRSDRGDERRDRIESVKIGKLDKEVNYIMK